MFNSMKHLVAKGMGSRGKAVAALLGATALLLGQPLSADSDPTRPPPGFGAPVADRNYTPGALPTVTAILSAANRRLALIDGQLTGVGETVSGGSVLRIERDHVLLRMNNETVRLGVAVQKIRRRPSSGER